MQESSKRRVTLNRTQLRDIVVAIDEQMRREGVPIAARTLQLAMRISEQLNTPLLWGTPVQDAAQEMLAELYPPGHLGIPASYAGAFLFKDVIYKINMGMILGAVTFDLDRLIANMPPERVRQLKADPEAYARYIDQCCDVADLALGFMDLKKRPLAEPTAMHRLEAGFAHLQQAAAGAVSADVSMDGVMHSVLLSSECFLKGALIASGFSDEQMRRHHGHNVASLVREFAQTYSSSDGEALGRASALIPGSVHERYEHMGYSKEAAGLGVMAAQFIGGEVVRELTPRDIRASLRRDGIPHRPPRTFP